MFPAPIKICGSRSSGWLESEIDAFIADRIAESRATPAEAE
jgi:predicted DNA-binding transcriptional regulator AlpA